MRFFSSLLAGHATWLKATFNCPKAYRDTFYRSKAQVTISVGQDIHESEYLEATLPLINRFKECKFMVDDAIQRHTHKIKFPNKSDAQLLAEANQAGDNYLARNQPIFERYLTIPYEIVRWKEWIDTPKWQQAVLHTEQLYQEEPRLAAAIDQTIHTFLERYERNQDLTHYNRAHAIACCRAYLIEECAVMKDLWPTLGCDFEVYPGGRNPAMAMTHQLYISKDLLKPVAIRFNRKHAYSHPQSLEGDRNETITPTTTSKSSR